MVVVMMGGEANLTALSHFLNILSMANTFEISSSIFTYTARPFFTQAFLVLFFPLYIHPSLLQISGLTFLLSTPPKREGKKSFTCPETLV